MPNEVIQTKHRLAAANKKHKGIVFTDKNGNIINDNSPEDTYSTEITGVSTGVGNVGNAGNTHTTESAGVDTRIGDAGNTERNAVETDMQDNMPEDEEVTWIGTNEGEEMVVQDSTRETPEIHEIHGTEEHVPETYEEPMAHDEQIIKEMNPQTSDMTQRQKVKRGIYQMMTTLSQLMDIIYGPDQQNVTTD